MARAGKTLATWASGGVLAAGLHDPALVGVERGVKRHLAQIGKKVGEKKFMGHRFQRKSRRPWECTKAASEPPRGLEKDRGSTSKAGASRCPVGDVSSRT